MQVPDFTCSIKSIIIFVSTDKMILINFAFSKLMRTFPKFKNMIPSSFSSFS